MAVHVPDLGEHYKIVANALRAGRPLVPFLGAGVNLCERAKKVPWNPPDSNFLPNGTELAAHLAASSTYPSTRPQELLRVSQFIAAKEGPDSIYDRLRPLFAGHYGPTRVHNFFASLPSILRKHGIELSLVILTTNYDDLLEKAFKSAEEPYDLLTYISRDLKNNDNAPKDIGLFRHYHYSPGSTVLGDGVQGDSKTKSVR